MTTERTAAVPSLPLTLTARLLPVVVLAIAGWAMSTSGDPGSADAQAAEPPGPRPETAARRYAEPPDACAALASPVVKALVPGAAPAGKKLDTTDPTRRAGCSWHALDGYDYRWLDVTFETLDEPAAVRSYTGKKKPTPAPGLGDEASVGTDLTQDDGQGTRESVVVVRKANALITITYNGSDFASREAPSEKTIREGALKAAREAVLSLADAES
ncbi:hypothetical protein ACH429_10290 [Streptomyces pathocidini]|uniref:DUF3558 domain-containing protein n=1 Tax=Streptomyces pathocidini TaxID=1650571 RepID=A0ABW7UUQ9_9ACTN|nr:hypothetical protein [Streptomyces pathocidini]